MIKIPSHIDTLAAYEPGASQITLSEGQRWEDIIMLASNENPLGVPASAEEAASEVMKKVNLYPDARGALLKEALAAQLAINPTQIHLGNGSDSILLRLMRAMCEGKEEVLTSQHTFAATSVQAHIQDVPIRYVPMQEGYTFDLEAILDQIQGHTKMIYLCNPNNPTGSMLPEKEVMAFLEKVPEQVLVIMDEAYYEFATFLSDEFPVYHTYARPNVLTLRTFSKAYGLAGLRIGYAIGDPAIISVLDKVSLPFEPNAVAQAAALAVLGDHTFKHRTVSLNKEVLTQYYQILSEIDIPYVSSFGNFVMLTLPNTATRNALFTHLLAQNILVRKLASLENCLRIGTGTLAQTTLLTAALKAFSLAEKASSM